MSQRASRKAKTAAADFFKRVIGGRDSSAELPSKAKTKATNKPKGSDSKNKSADANQKSADSKAKPAESKGKTASNKKSTENKEAVKCSDTRSNTRSTSQIKDGSPSSAQASPRAKSKAETKVTRPEVKVTKAEVKVTKAEVKITKIDAKVTKVDAKVPGNKAEGKVTDKSSGDDNGLSVQALRGRPLIKASDLESKVTEEEVNKGRGRRGKKEVEMKDEANHSPKGKKAESLTSQNVEKRSVVSTEKVSQLAKPVVAKSPKPKQICVPEEATATRSPKPKLTSGVDGTAANRSPKVKVVSVSATTPVKCQKVISVMTTETKVSNRSPKAKVVLTTANVSCNKVKVTKKAAEKIVDRTMPKLEREEPIPVLRRLDIDHEPTAVLQRDQQNEGLRSLLDDVNYQSIIRSSSRGRRMSSPESPRKSSHTPARSQTKSLLSSLHKSKEKQYRHTLLPGNQNDSSPPRLSPKTSPQNQFLHLLNTSPKAKLIFPDGDCEDREMPVLLPEAPLDASAVEEAEEPEECVRRVPKSPMVTPELPSVLPNDKPVCLPADVFTQCQFYAMFGLIKKTELKVVTGKENKLHRTAGGRLRRTIKPRICPEMVSDFVLTKSGAVQDTPGQWQESSSSSSSDDEDDCKIIDGKNALKPRLLKPEDVKRLQLSPKMVAALAKSKDHLVGAACKSASAPSTPEKRALLTAQSKMSLASLDKLKPIKPDPSTSRKLTFETGECKNKKKEFMKPTALVRHSSDPSQNKTGCTSGTSGKSIKDLKLLKSNQSKQYIKQLDARTKPSADTKCKYHSSKSESKTPDKKKTLQNKSKSFENKPKPTSLQVKSKSFDSRLGKGGPATRATAKLKEEEEDDGTRRSARQRGTKRKQWWHLLRANPDEYEVDKQWEEEQAEKARKKNEREERKAEEKRTEEDGDQEELLSESEIKKEEEEEGEEEEKEGKVKEKNTNVDSNSSKGKKSAKRKAEGSLGQAAKKIKSEPDVEVKKEGEEKAVKKKKKKREILEKIDVMSSVLTMCVSGHNKAFQFMSMSGDPLLAPQNPGLFEGLKEILPWLARETDKLLFHGAVEYPVKRSVVYGTGPVNGSVLGYQDMESQCVTPHMCPICWINDHMYCRNMRRTARDLVPNGGCLHYIPCRHYKRVCHSKAGSHPGSMPHGFDACSPGGMEATSVTIRDGHLLCKRPYHSPTGDSPIKSQRPCSLPSCVTPKPATPCTRPPETPEDLYCHEQLVESDPEPNSPPTPAGTEALRVQLKARAIHLARSMGIADQDLMDAPVDLTPPAVCSPTPKTPVTTTVSVGPELEVELEEYGAEVEIGNSDIREADPVMTALLLFSNQTDLQEVKAEQSPQDPESQQQMWLRLALYEMNITKPYFTFVDEKKYRFFRVTVEQLESPSGVSKLEKPVAGSNKKESKTDKSKRTLSPDEKVPKKKRKKEVEDDGSNSARSVTPSVSSDVIEGSQDSQGTLTSEPCSTGSIHTEADGSGLSTDDSDAWDSDLDAESYASLDMVSQNEDGTYKPVFRPIQIHSHVTRLPSTLRREVTSGSDGSQMLQFSTKDIREHKPELLAYIKRAGLISVIAKALSQEKTTLLKLIQEGEQQLSELQDSMEQSRCLLIAVQSEIKSVQDEILAVQKSMLQDESQSVRIRKHVKQMESHYTDTQKRLNLCRASLKYLGVEEPQEETPSEDATSEKSSDQPPEKVSSPQAPPEEDSSGQVPAETDQQQSAAESAADPVETDSRPASTTPDPTRGSPPAGGESASVDVPSVAPCPVESSHEDSEQDSPEAPSSTVLDARPPAQPEGAVMAVHVHSDTPVTEDVSEATSPIAEDSHGQNEDSQGQMLESQGPSDSTSPTEVPGEALMEVSSSESCTLTDSVSLTGDVDGEAEIINIVVTQLPDGMQTEGESGNSSPIVTHLVVTENEEEGGTDLVKDAMTAAFVQPEVSGEWMEEGNEEGEVLTAVTVDENSCVEAEDSPADVVSYIMVEQAEAETGSSSGDIISITAEVTEGDSHQSGETAGEEPMDISYIIQTDSSPVISVPGAASPTCSTDPAVPSDNMLPSELVVASQPALVPDSQRTPVAEVIPGVVISDNTDDLPVTSDTPSPSQSPPHEVEQPSPASTPSPVPDKTPPHISEPTDLAQTSIERQSDSPNAPQIEHFLSVIDPNAVVYTQPVIVEESSSSEGEPPLVANTHVGIDYSSLVLTSHPVTSAITETMAAATLDSHLMGPEGSSLPYLEDSMDVAESSFSDEKLDSAASVESLRRTESSRDAYAIASPTVDMAGLLPQVDPDIEYPTSFGLLSSASQDFPSVIVEQEPTSKAVETLAIGEDSGLGSSQETGESLF